jgi:hypothetical protein
MRMKEKKLEMNEAVTAKIVDSLKKRNLRERGQKRWKNGVSSRAADGFLPREREVDGKVYEPRNPFE